MDSSVRELNLTRLHPGSKYTVQLQAEAGGRFTSSVSTEFTTGTKLLLLVFLVVIKSRQTTHDPFPSSSLLFFRRPEVPLPHRLLSGAAERHRGVRRGGDLPSGEPGSVHDGLLRHGDGRRRLDGAGTSAPEWSYSEMCQPQV